MPVSRSNRRRGRRRPKPPVVKTRPKRRRFSRFIPYIFFSAIGAGVVLILLTYIIWDGRPLTLFTGLGLIGFAFAVSTQWY